MKEVDLTISVVLYKNNPTEIQNLITCIEQTLLDYNLFFVDNSPSDKLRFVENKKNTVYIFNNKNIGFGHAQNIAIKRAIKMSKYHLILNPDITFGKDVLEKIFLFMEQHHEIGQLMPKVFYPDGKIQKLCKLLPSPIDLFGRRFLSNAKYIQQRNKRYELDGFEYDRILDTPNLSGCFMFIRSSVLKEVKGFDSRYFMYLEDFDLTRRIHKIARTVFYPEVSVTHGFNKGSYASAKLLKHHIISAIKYFNKWGWFFDKERRVLNKKILSQLNGNYTKAMQIEK